MKVSLVIIKYPWWAVPFAFLGMAVFRLPLFFSSRFSFWALMGSGKNGSFDLQPDLRQWAVLLVEKTATVSQEENIPALSSPGQSPLPSFIKQWTSFFNCKTIVYTLLPIEGHGFWNGKKVFGELPKHSGHTGEIAVLTRATIRLSKLRSFWKNVPAVAGHTCHANGLIKSYGIGEIPFIKQATFSIWESKAAMKAFAYSLKEHQDVIRKTHTENWYREELFVRFKVVGNVEM